MTQKEAEEILLAAGWVVHLEMSSFRTWTYLNGRHGVDIWKDDCVEYFAQEWRATVNKANFAKIPPELLYPKEIANVLRHCT